MANYRKPRAAKNMNKGHWTCKDYKHFGNRRIRALRPSERRRAQDPVR